MRIKIIIIIIIIIIIKNSTKYNMLIYYENKLMFDWKLILKYSFRNVYKKRYYLDALY